MAKTAKSQSEVTLVPTTDAEKSAFSQTTYTPLWTGGVDLLTIEGTAFIHFTGSDGKEHIAVGVKATINSAKVQIPLKSFLPTIKLDSDGNIRRNSGILTDLAQTAVSTTDSIGSACIAFVKATQNKSFNVIMKCFKKDFGSFVGTASIIESKKK